ncbi:MAG: pilus assembly protein [Planctomycetes bacterium]|nr:pilus assembly protein [Planctomycetota bacterium]
MRRPPAKNRRGAVAVETAIIALVFLTLVLGMLELSIAVFRYNIVSQGARQAARLAIVRGELAPPKLDEWGPATYTSGANSGNAVTETIKPYLTGLDLDNTTITIEWLDGSTKLQDRVHVTIVTSHEVFLPFVANMLSSSTFALRADSTMQITH